MPTLSHGSDLRLAPTIRPIASEQGVTPRQAIRAIASLGFSAVQLDATLAGMRPRELDSSARRDLSATVIRAGLSIAGLDFFIPADHFYDPVHMDRAADAAAAACTLAADLGRLPLSINLPFDDADPSLKDALFTAADALSVPLVICHAAAPETLKQWLDYAAETEVAFGIDPAAMLTARYDPAQAMQALGGSIGVARLSDAKQGQAEGRVPVGSGDLDVLTYRVSVDLAKPKYGPVVLDLRGLASPSAAASTGMAAWEQAQVNL